MAAKIGTGGAAQAINESDGTAASLDFYQRNDGHNMSETKSPTAEPKRRRKPQPRLAKNDALSILRTAIVECQRSGIVVALAANQAGSLLLLRDIDLIDGVFISRDTNGLNHALPLFIATSGNGGNNERNNEI